jgi:Lipocalin-like domain
VSKFAVSLTVLTLALLEAGMAVAGPAIDGTYRLVSMTRTILETGKKEDAFGPNPIGYIIYGRDHHMMVLIVQQDRPKPTFKSITDQDKIGLFDSMAAYCGTYSFDGKTVVHSIDVSYNQILTGTQVIRTVRVEGKRLIYTTAPGPAPTDGKIVTSELIWEKVEPNAYVK